MTTIKTEVLIIGGGATGTGVARDLALRGVKCILVESFDINSGASGRNHGLLHSGARYVYKDIESAKECKSEGDIIKRLAPHCIENTGGFFIAVAGDDEKYIADYPGFCERSGIPCKQIDVKDALELEPELSPKTIAVYEVEDATIDPFRISLENITQAQKNGTLLMRNTKVIRFQVAHKKIERVHTKNTTTGEEQIIEAVQVVNAAGAWAGMVADLAGCAINILYSKGSLLIAQNRITDRVINRLRPPGDADILVPGGTVSILGTTSLRIESLDDIRPTVNEVDFIIDEGNAMLPILNTTRYTRAFSGVRPLIGLDNSGEDRNVSREFALIDHSQDQIENFATIAGGKLTIFRLMAEKTSDLVCQHLGVDSRCLTAIEPLPNDSNVQWTEPGLSPKVWIKNHQPDDVLLCECEMVPKSAIQNIVKEIKKFDGTPDLISIGLRSRVGKGSCQGSFCSARITAALYDADLLDGNQGVISLKDFLNERWKGQRTIFWGDQLAQAELSEAIHCGLFSLEL